VGVYFETSVGIVREGTTAMTKMQKTVLRVALAALGMLMVPLVASRVVEGWNWGPGAFLFTYVMFFGTGMAYTLIARKMNAWVYKAAVGLALVAGFVLGWATMVPIGALLARLEARGLSLALFAMAASLVLAWVITQVIFSDTPAGPVWNVGVMHGGFVLLFALAGLLFRHASLAGQK
jgi:hypothetical protein